MNLTEGVVAQLRARIVDGGLTPGEKLPSESELMEEFSVSRTVVREALSRLQAAGLVETYRGRGTFVLTIPSDEAFSVEASSVRTLAERLELLDFRLAFEVEAASLAAARRSPDELRELSQALDVFRASRAKPSGAVDADFQFHLKVAAAANNRYFVDLLTSLGPTIIAMPQTRLRAPEGPERDTHYDRVVAEHEAIYTAIEAGDSPGAAAAMRTHLSNSRHRLSRQKV